MSADFVELWDRLDPGEQLAIEKAIEIVIVSRKIQQADSQNASAQPPPPEPE